MTLERADVHSGDQTNPHLATHPILPSRTLTDPIDQTPYTGKRRGMTLFPGLLPTTAITRSHRTSIRPSNIPSSRSPISCPIRMTFQQTICFTHYYSPRSKFLPTDNHSLRPSYLRSIRPQVWLPGQQNYYLSSSTSSARLPKPNSNTSFGPPSCRSNSTTDWLSVIPAVHQTT